MINQKLENITWNAKVSKHANNIIYMSYQPHPLTIADRNIFFIVINCKCSNDIDHILQIQYVVAIVTVQGHTPELVVDP